MNKLQLKKSTIEKLSGDQMSNIFGGIEEGGCSKKNSDPLRSKSCVSQDKTNVEVTTVIKCNKIAEI
jgi:hypothetical protein